MCFTRIEGRHFGDVPFDIEARLNVEDSPNSAGVVIDAIREAKIAMDRGREEPIPSLSAAFMKHPPDQPDDAVARALVERFILGDDDPGE